MNSSRTCTPPGPDHRTRRGHHRRRGAVPGPRIREEACPRGRQGTVGRELCRHRQGVPHQADARTRRAPALPDHRRLLDQGTVKQWFPAPTSRRRPSMVGTAHSATSSTRSSSSSTTGRPCSPPRTELRRGEVDRRRGGRELLEPHRGEFLRRELSASAGLLLGAGEDVRREGT